MAITITFKGGKAALQGDGLDNLKYNEHELIRTLATVMGGKVVEEYHISFNEHNMISTIGKTI